MDDTDALQQQMTATHEAASQFAAQLVGLTRSEAADRVASDGRFRVQFLADGAMVTLDFRPDRIRATVVDDVVVSATAG